MPIRRAAATPPQDKAPSPAPEEEPAEDSPTVMEDEEGATDSPVPAEEEGEVGASSKTNGEGGATEGTGDGDAKTDTEAQSEGHAMPTVANGDSVKCQDCAEGQCATHCFVLLKRIKDGAKLGRSSAKKLKKTVPPWAFIPANKKVAVASGFARATPKVDGVLLEALQSSSDRTGMSYQSIMKYVMKKYPSLELDKRKYLVKKAIKKHLERGTIKQLKGKGLAGSYAAQKQPANKRPASSVAGAMKSEALGDALPLIITRLCEPKEASYILIKKYMEQHFPQFHIDNRPDLLKAALIRAVDKGHLERITGKGANGTFQLKRTGDKVVLAGGPLEDAITSAIIAMNEPKTCSMTTLRKYLFHTHQDRSETRIVTLMRKTLARCKMLGWMDQITGSGLNGTYRLAFPYYPSPAVLFPDHVFASQKKKKPSQRTADTSEEEESEEEESEESEEEEDDDDEPPPPKRKATKRPPPKSRRPPPSKKPRSASQSKARGKRPAPAKKPASLSKKNPPPAPAKKTTAASRKAAAAPAKATPAKATPAKATPAKATPAKATPAKATPAKATPAKATQAKAAPAKAAPPAKATPVKRAAPAKRPKTPAVKKLSARGSKAAAPKKSSPKKEPVKKEVKAKPTARKSLRAKK